MSFQEQKDRLAREGKYLMSENQEESGEVVAERYSHGKVQQDTFEGEFRGTFSGIFKGIFMGIFSGVFKGKFSGTFTRTISDG